ncbi:mate-domain-containing protein [Gilbertella persicaria]|uniref:mate-domain-containing protein n=1 Tax=Gilbertella persicaria TaxID=101096 RepID=UPI002220F151|nr:mate-domain-containing protein [Gilbertella persicaria]KAI8083240.1 mate-domain-containing protein [Gilbertella persicaria]
MSNKQIYHQDSDSSSSFSSTLTESTPLIGHKDVDHTTVRQELKWLLTNSLPIIGTYFLQNSFQLASIFTLGHLGQVELGASALASMFVNVSAWSISYGITSALDTLCSQAWTGSKDKTVIGVHLQRAYLVLLLLYIPIACVWWNATPIMLSFNQEPDVANFAGLFLKYLLPGAPAYMAFEATKRYLQAQGIMHASTLSMLVTAPINLVLNYMFVYTLNLGFIGAPLATSLSYWLMFLLLLAYIKHVKGSEGWSGWSQQCLTGWWPFLKLASSGIVIICAEWAAFEMSSLAASYLGTTDLAAQSILLTLSSATYTVPMGIAVAATNRVGNCLGGGFAYRARTASKSAILFSILFALVNSAFFLLTRHQIGYLFTSEPKVVIMVAHVLPLCAIFQVTDGIASVGGGVIRGLGRQSVAAMINLIAYYVIALPIGFYLTFRALWALTGLWTGLSIALFLVAAGEVMFLYKVDWFLEMKKAQQRCINHHE